MYAYVMEWGSDYIPSDADGEGSLKWFCKTERTMAEDAIAAYYVGCATYKCLAPQRG